MLPHYLPCRVSRGAATLPHRLPLRSIPPPRFACGASHSRDMGVHGLCGRVPDSAGNVSPWIAASAQTDANLSTHLHRLPTPPPYLRRMRLSPGRGRRYRVQDMAAALPCAGVWCWIWLPLGRRGGDGWQIMLLVVRVAVPANHRARFKNVIYL